VLTDEEHPMKSRIPMLWLAVLTVWQSYVCTDALSTLKTVESNQDYTLRYMAKSAEILKKFKKVKVTAVASAN
jgi:hypothetical protein